MGVLGNLKLKANNYLREREEYNEAYHESYKEEKLKQLKIKAIQDAKNNVKRPGVTESILRGMGKAVSKMEKSPMFKEKRGGNLWYR